MLNSIKMFKKIILVFAVAGTLFFISCGESNNKTDGKKNETATSSTRDSQAPTMKISEADWAEADLSSISTLIPVTVKLPKDAKMEKNGNGGVDIHISDWYLITVSNIMASDIKSAITDTKSATVNHQGHQDGKIVLEESNGFVYTYTMKTEQNGTKYQPESHFVYFIEKDGAIYSFESSRPLDNYAVAGSAYTEDIAKQIYNIIKSSAKAK